MQIIHGLLPGQVLQRDRRNRSRARITGSSPAKGPLFIRVLDAGQTMAGFDWLEGGSVAGQDFQLDLVGLPVGGPYSVEIQVRKDAEVLDKTRVEEIFVGDVWILGGQSNMEGVGVLRHAPEPQPEVRAFFMRDEWGMAREKLHFLAEAVDTIHNGYGKGPKRPSDKTLEEDRKAQIKGMSPGLAFALEMQKRTGVPQGLIPCAHGGTSMAQWSPELRDEGGASLYGAMMRRMEKLAQAAAGVLWYQGESDANAEGATLYTDRMRDLVAASRKDLDLPDLPWMIVQIGRHIAPDGEYWNSIQEQQRRLPEHIPNLDVVPAVDLRLDDGIHISGEDQNRLGRRLARIADRLVRANAEALPGIALESVEMAPVPDTHETCPWKALKLTYGNVAGELSSEGRPNGYALLDSTGAEVPGIFKTTLVGNTVLLHTDKGEAQLATLALSYGHGRCPYCNIRDGKDMSIPAMQAVPIVPAPRRRAEGPRAKS